MSSKACLLAVGVEAEVGVEFGAGGGAVLAGGKDHEVLARPDQDVRESPLCQVQRVVGQVVTAEKGGVSTRVVKLDPVRGIPVLIDDHGACRAHGQFQDDGYGYVGWIVRRHEQVNNN